MAEREGRMFFARVYANIKTWLSKRWGLALLSLLFAVMLWNLVISEADPLRQNAIQDISLSVRGMDRLTSQSLTVKGNIYSSLPLVTVRVEMPRSDIQRNTNADINAYIDLSGIVAPGTYEVPIFASSSRGTVEGVSPERVKVVVEDLVNKILVVECVVEGEPEPGYWYSKPELSATRINVSGAKSDMDGVDRARVIMDITGLTAGQSKACYFDYMDTQGNTVRDRGISSEIPNVIVTISIYPVKEIALSPGEFLLNVPADGYEVSSISTYPKNVTVVGSQALLDSLTSLFYEAVDVGGLKEDVQAKRTLELPEGLEFLFGGEMTSSTMEVQIIAHITPKITQQTFENAQIAVTNLAKGLRVAQPPSATVTVTAQELFLRGLKAGQLGLYIDCAGLEAGTHDIEVKSSLPQINSGQVLSVVAAPEKVRVTITK